MESRKYFKISGEYSNYNFIPVVIVIFCLYFSFIQRKINKNYKNEYTAKIQKLKENNEQPEKIEEEWDRIKNKYTRLSNQQFYISVIAISKCLLNYEDLIGVAIVLYGLHKIVEGYKEYKLDSKYKILELVNKKEDSSQIINTRNQIKSQFIHVLVHALFYTLSLFIGFMYSKSKRFWHIAVMSNSINRNSDVINYLYGAKNVVSFYALFFTLYVICYRLFIEKNYRVFDENFSLTFRTLFSVKQNKMNMYIYLGITLLCLLRSVLIY